MMSENSYCSEVPNLNEKTKKQKAPRTTKFVKWTEEEDRQLFLLYKKKGSCWSSIATEFEGRNENQVKNRFYSTLRRLAIKKNIYTKASPGKHSHKSRKEDLIKFVDDAILYGHHCRSKRGRKKKSEVIVNEEELKRMNIMVNENENILKNIDEKIESTNKVEELTKIKEEIGRAHV